jgi:type VI secretion system ImpM family protein
MFNSNSGNNKNIVSGFFGKLPGFPDFIKYNSAGKEILAIDSWLQEGLALAKLKFKNDWKSYYNNLTKINFIYPFTGTDNITIGSISSSNDQSGRSYPFIMFSIINKSSITELSNFLIPYAFKEILFELDKIIAMNKMAEDTANLKHSIDNLRMQNLVTAYILSDYRKFLSGAKLSNMFELEEGNETSLNDLIEKHIKIYEHFVSISYKIISDQPDDFVLVCFCIQLLQKIFKNSNSAAVFWFQCDDNSGLLFLSFTKPTPKDFVDLMLNNSSSNAQLEIIDEHIKREYHSGKSLVKDGSTINNNVSLNEFLNVVETHLN